MRLQRGLQKLSLCAGLAALTACIPQPPRHAKAPQAATTIETAGASNCSSRVSAPWTAAGKAFTADALTDGPDCARAVAILIIRDAKGEAIWTDTFNTSQNMALASASNAKTMRTALAAWIAPEEGKTTADLPEWAMDQTQPVMSEFPFYPEEDVNRERYAELRAQKLPMFCYVQGMESQACLALEDGALQKIGVQSFPG